MKGYFIMSSIKKRIFTSESVCNGHPDKICDAISDAILDSAISIDPLTRAGIETVCGANKVEIFGEIKTKASLDYLSIVKKTIRNLGYINPNWGFSDQSLVDINIHQQSSDIAIGVDGGGAGDQGMMFGFAVNETDQFMPMPIAIAHAITKKIDEVRIKEQLPWLRPDGKAQLTIEYENDQPKKVLKLVAAVAHSEDIDAAIVKDEVICSIFKPVLDLFQLDMPNMANIIVNGTGVWHIPGPQSDTGLTGRKIVVDSYGGYARVGGGAFSGKDPSKVDRSGAYAARYIAKNIVANGLANKCEVGLAYVIGHSRPLMQTIDTFNSSNLSDKALRNYMNKLIDTSVNGIIERLDLRKPIYSKTSAYGHFGKAGLPWETIV